MKKITDQRRLTRTFRLVVASLTFAGVLLITAAIGAAIIAFQG